MKLTPIVKNIGTISGLFKELGAKLVFDVEAVSDLALFECGRDFVHRFRENKVISIKYPLPVLASACPGMCMIILKNIAILTEVFIFFYLVFPMNFRMDMLRRKDSWRLDFTLWFV